MNLHRKINSNELGHHLKFSPWSPNTKKYSIGKLDTAKSDEILDIFKNKVSKIINFATNLKFKGKNFIQLLKFNIG